MSVSSRRVEVAERQFFLGPFPPSLPPFLAPYLPDPALADPLDDELLQDAVDSVGVGDGGLGREGGREGGKGGGGEWSFNKNNFRIYSVVGTLDLLAVYPIHPSRLPSLPLSLHPSSPLC